MSKVMAANIASLSVVGEWICRDSGGWRVRVPCQNGHGYFGIKESGGSANALKQARLFHNKAVKQLQKDRKFYSETGERPERTTLNIRNRSGYTGVARHVYPNLSGSPLIVFVAYYNNKDGKQLSKRFSLTEYKHEEYALKAAIEWRKSKKGHR